MARNTTDSPVDYVENGKKQWKEFSWELVNPNTFISSSNFIPVLDLWMIAKNISKNINKKILNLQVKFTRFLSSFDVVLFHAQEYLSDWVFYQRQKDKHETGHWPDINGFCVRDFRHISIESLSPCRNSQKCQNTACDTSRSWVDLFTSLKTTSDSNSYFRFLWNDIEYGLNSALIQNEAQETMTQKYEGMNMWVK